MEVADQWRREWAGTAEYGKVTEGGVTRQIARAMEVLHASAPGARVRVMRAAYHSSAGPGAPAASYMMHSSRRVISSGFNFLESPTIPIKPLEISSTPLESSPESNAETENYKVTEPDDLDISEPSKWRSAKGGSSIRMPSEESSSTDNASIIDLDSRSSRNLHRKYSYDSESSDVQFGKRSSTRASPLLDPPATLSTLKYKSLLNSSNDWNTRRKSYSFEDTSPINETILHSNDTLAMESSTDSGICKSSEIVNEHMDDTHTKYLAQNEIKTLNNDESFKDWLSRNRPTSHYKGTKFKTYREHEIVLEDPIENNITVQPSGKVSITLPISVNKDDNNQHKKGPISDDGERKVKKVEFCKTEVHFAAESGKVNIIATDEKPPPSNDFRRRRSAFVPMHEMIDKPITLFGEKNDDLATHSGTSNLFNNYSNGEFSETDENTAATKSILKNKIPKPKPYLLGENMGFGLSDDLQNKDHYNRDSVLSAVQLVNKQTDKRCDNEIKSIFLQDTHSDNFKNVCRTINKGPSQHDSIKHEAHIINVKTETSTQGIYEKNDVKSAKNKFNVLQASPVQGRLKTRELRDSDLTYFGVDNERKRIDKEKIQYFESKFKTDKAVEEIFHSVKLIQQVSNSVCNSEVESEDGHDYQNIPLNNPYAPIPTPRLRSKYDDKPNEISEIKVLKPIIEKENDEIMDVVKPITRRSKLRRQDETISNRSLSAPPKSFRNRSIEKPQRFEDQSTRSSKYQLIKESVKNTEKKISPINRKSTSDDENHIYENLDLAKDKLIQNANIKPSGLNSQKTRQVRSQRADKIEQKKEITNANSIDRAKIVHQLDTRKNNNSPQTKHSLNKHSISRTEKTDHGHRKLRDDDAYYVSRNAQCTPTKNTRQHGSDKKKEDHRRSSSQRSSHKIISEDAITGNTNGEQRENDAEVVKPKHEGDRDENKHRTRILSKDKMNSRRHVANPIEELISSSSERHSSAAQVKNKEKETNSRLNSHRSKRSEYVINYDDKNGTVSSVTKIKAGLGTPRRKKTSKDMLQETPKSDTLKSKTVNINRIALLQLEDHQGDPNRMSYADRKWKTKVHVQRSCQVL